MDIVTEIIDKLNLKPHPEGGYFRETYRSIGEIPNKCLNEEYTGARNYSTSIYFLLQSENFSAFHKINQDEFWHFYDGSPIKIHMIDQEGNYSFSIVGKNILEGESPQFVVKGGVWFAAEVMDKKSYSLVGCTVSPGFSFDDFTLPSRKEMISLYPQHKEIISKLTH